jgi:hypothetical protein
MADPVLVSFGIRSINGKTKRFPAWFPSGTEPADVAATINALADAIDDCVDGVLTDIIFHLPIALPGGIKTDPVDGNMVREGALLTFDAAGTSHDYSVYLPSASNDNFVGDTVDNTVSTMAVLTGLLEDSTGTDPNQTDTAGRDLVAFQSGKRTFRK